MSKISRKLIFPIISALSLMALVSMVPASSSAQEDYFSNVEKAELQSVYLIEGSGVSYRGSVENGIEYYTVADIQDAPESMFYEVWLVKEPPEVGFVSLGKLEKVDNLHFLRVLTEENLNDYVGIVVTLESESAGLDGIPEQQILEGVFIPQSLIVN